MRKHRAVWAGLMTVVLAGAVAPGRPAAAAPAPPPLPPAGTSTSELVLITGDRVAVGSGGAVSVEPGAGRAGIGFSTFRDAGGHVHVVPSDAERLVAAGTVDAGLFDVTAL